MDKLCGIATYSLYHCWARKTAARASFATIIPPYNGRTHFHVDTTQNRSGFPSHQAADQHYRTYCGLRMQSGNVNKFIISNEGNNQKIILRNPILLRKTKIISSLHTTGHPLPATASPLVPADSIVHGAFASQSPSSS